MPVKMLHVRAVGEGDAAYSCPRPDGEIRHGSRFLGRDRAGAILAEGERVPWSLHVLDLVNQGQLELVAVEQPDGGVVRPPAPAPAPPHPPAERTTLRPAKGGG